MNDRLRETDAKPLTPEEIKLIAADPRGYEASFGHHAVRDRLLATIERQGKALRAVESLESFGATVELTTLLGTREMVTGAEVEVVSAAQLRAALDQTEPQTADEAKENPS